MKARVEKLEKEVERNNSDIQHHNEDITRLDAEVVTLREFKHVTNGTLHNHNGKLDTIANQQSTTTAAIERLTSVVEDAIKKIGKLETIKAMAIGAGLIIPPVVGACWFVFQWYIKSLGIE